MIWILVQILLVAAAIGMLLYYLRGPLLGMIVTFVAKLVLKKTFKQFKLASLNLLPFSMLDFSVTLHATRKSPEITVSWTSFRILMDITKIFDPLLSLLNVLDGKVDDNAPPRVRMISFVFEGFKASSPDFNFALFLDPPANKVAVPEGPLDANGDVKLPNRSEHNVVSYMMIMKRLSQHMILFVDIIFKDFSFNFTFPPHESQMIGSATVMTISFPRWPAGSTQTVSMMDQIEGGEIEILQRDVRAMYYVGRLARLSVDMHLPTGVMDVMFRVLGRDHDRMYVSIAPFLEFYRNYAHAEDNSIEIRLARGLPLGGKMTMNMECEYIDVHLTDNRCAEPLHMTIQELTAGLKTYSLTRSGERLYKGRLEEPASVDKNDTAAEASAAHNMFQYFMRDRGAGPIIMGPNKEKVMKGSVKRLDFHTREEASIAYVEEASGLKVKRVFNEGNFVDDDRMDGYAKCVYFEKIHTYMLDWLIVLQDTANRLPDSRFAHKKNSEMFFHGVDILFSTQPVSFAYIAPLVPGSKEEQNAPPNFVSDPPLETLDVIPVDENHWMCLKFNNLEAKRELPFGEHDALIDVKSTMFKMETSMPQVGLLSLFSLTAVGDYDVSEAASSESGNSSYEDQNEQYYELCEATPGRIKTVVPDAYETDSDEEDGEEEAQISAVPFSTATSFSVKPSRMSLDPPLAETESSPRNLSLPQQSPMSQSQSRASTGTRWTFPGFSVRLKLGLKMHLEWAQATSMTVEFANSTASDVIHHRPTRLPIQCDPFMHASKLYVLWSGPSFTTDLGKMNLKASVAGMMKAQTGFSMIMKTSNRMNARMLYMKLRGWGPIAHPVPPEVPHSNEPPPPPPRTTVRFSELEMDVPVEISAEDHDKRLQHELARQQKEFLRAQQQLERKRALRKRSLGSNASDVDDPGNESVPLPGDIPSGVNRGDKGVKFTLTGMTAAMSSVDMAVSFNTCCATLNGYPERPWMDMKSFQMHKSIVPLVEEDAFYQGLDLQGSIEAAAITTKTSTEISFDSFEMYLSARMELGLTLDALQLQSSAFGIASKPPTRRRLAEQQSMEDDERTPSNASPFSPHSPFGDDQSLSEERPGPPIRAFSTRYEDEVEEEEEMESEDPNMEMLKPNPSCMQVKFRSFAINYDAHFNRDYIEDFLRVEYLGIDMTLDSTKLPSVAQDEITTLDLGAEGADEDLGHLEELRSSGLTPKGAEASHPSRLLVYTGIFGGQLKFFTKYFKVAFKTSKEPFVEMEDLCFRGPMYNASVKDDRVPKGEYLVALSDSVLTYAFEGAVGERADEIPIVVDDLEHSPMHTVMPASVMGSTEPLYVVVTKSAAPGKIYMDMTMSGTSMDVVMSANTMECVAAVNAVMDCVMPPVKDPSPHLMLWDTLRYLTHGSFAFHFQRMSIVYSAQDYMTQRVKLRVSMEQPKWYMDQSSYSFTSQNIGVEAELITALLGGRRGRIKRASGKSAQATEISKLCSIPALVLSLNHFREDIRAKFANNSATESNATSAASSSNNIPNFAPLSETVTPPSQNAESSLSHATYSHHDVYLNPAYNLPHSGALPPGGVLEDIQYLKGDKFFHFRSQIMTSRWEVEMRLADHEDLPICFNFRLDHLSRILDAFKPAPVDRFAVPEELEGCLDQASDYFYGAMRPLTHVAMGDMISVLKLQMIINRVMISSWSSSTNLGGIVMNIANTDMQLRLLRDIPEELSAPKKPEPETSKGRRRTVRTRAPDDDQTDKTQVLAAFPLKIDHLFMDTAFLELYVRDWRMNGGVSTPLDKRKPNFRASLTHALQFDAENADEPKKFEEIQALFVPIYKNAHATKMVISLTESGVVCTRDNQFTPSGIMDKSTERLKKASQVAVSSKQQSARSSRRFNTQSALLAAATAELESKGAFLIGKEWKEHLARTAAAVLAEKSSNNLRQFASTPFAGRRPSALSMMMASSKLGSILVSPNANRLSLMRSNADGGSSVRESHKSSRRRSVQSARFARPHSDSIISTGNESNNFPFHPALPQGTRPVGNLRNRRSSIRSMKVDRLPVRQAAWDPLVDGYRASLLSFVTNHSAFSPPPSALPTSYVLNSAGFVQGKTAQQASMFQQSEEESSFGSKIWGLKITDMRFLFTIEIRDILFLYVARGIELFQEGPAEPAADGSARRRPSSIQRKKEKDAGNGDRKATIYDFLQYPDKETQKSTQKGSGKSTTRKSTKSTTEERDKFGFSPLRTDLPLKLDDPMLQFLAMRNERTGSPRNNGELSLAQLVDANASKLATTPRSVNSKVVYQKGGRTLARNNNAPINYSHDENDDAEQTSAKKISARDALEGPDSEDDEKVNAGSSKNNSSMPAPAGVAQSDMQPPPSPPRTDSNANSMPKVASYNSLYLGAPAPPIGQLDGAKNRSGSAIFSSANAVPVGVSPKVADKTKKKKPLSEFFFLIELIDPQVNFLDVKTHSSLIIVAGRSSVEGKRYTDATLPPRHDVASGGDGRASMAGGHADPKRQQEVRLRMDGVSAFTVPSNSSTDPTDESDSVYWKHMESTQCLDGGELGFYGKRGQGAPATPESPFMRMAIKDFQIRALYIFWTDVTVKEARTMHLNPSKEDLVGTFKLELPVICVDICSWQFYVIMHVVRNVLLVPPPATASRAQQTQSEVEEAEKNKVLELMRDPVLLAKHDMRANLNVPLDMKNKTARDELKLLIEGNLAGAMMNMELGSARFVEVFVGSCTWILRSNGIAADKPTVESGNNLRDWEKEQLKVELTGAHATFSYNEDRSASSLFEVQRFWIKDMDPARDAIALTKTHGSGLFRKHSLSDVHLRDDAKIDSIVMMPILSQTEHCARCGAAFLLEENHATACTFHANRDGDPGEYKDLVVMDPLSGVQNTFKAWTCCGRHHAFAPGCSARPHTCKEVMLQIRAETNPTTRVENIDLSILKGVDISIFPNSAYDLQVHITKSLVDVLHKYFSIDDIENYEITAVIPEPPPEAEKRPKGWKRVKKVGKLLLPKKNKSSHAEDDEDGHNTDLQSPSSDKSFFNSPEPGSPMRSPLKSERSASPTTPRMNKESRSILSSPWFSRSASPKRSASASHRDRASNVVGDDIAAASSNNSSNSSLRLLDYVPTLGMGRLFSRKQDSSESIGSHTESTMHASSTEDTQSSSQVRSFNMMRKRANTVGNNNPNATSERRSISDGMSGMSSSGDALDKQIATMALTNRRQEGLYVKFLRLGGIQIEVSTQGFILNLTRFKAQMDEFRCQGEVLQWSTLIGNMERHLAMSLLANAASNSLSRFTHMFRFPGQRDTDYTNSTDDNSLEQVNKKSAFVIWEGAQDVHTATSMKRSALGLPPSKGKATLIPAKSAPADVNASNNS